MRKVFPVLFAVFAATSFSAVAAPCDYTPSRLVGAGVAGVGASVAGSAAAAGIGLKAAGIYAITNATTGAAMLGTTAAGASAAGTGGIIAGTAGVVGTVGGVLLSPFVIIPSVIVAGGVAAYEGTCYLATKK